MRFSRSTFHGTASLRPNVSPFIYLQHWIVFEYVNHIPLSSGVVIGVLDDDERYVFMQSSCTDPYFQSMDYACFTKERQE